MSNVYHSYTVNIILDKFIPPIFEPLLKNVPDLYNNPEFNLLKTIHFPFIRVSNFLLLVNSLYIDVFAIVFIDSFQYQLWELKKNQMLDIKL